MYQIYKIFAVENPSLYYIGSSKEKLNIRIAKHKYRYKKYNENPSNGRYKCFDLFDKYGFDNCTIEPLETLETTVKREAEMKEAEWIRKDRVNCINKVIPGRTKSEWYRDRKNQTLSSNTINAVSHTI